MQNKKLSEPDADYKTILRSLTDKNTNSNPKVLLILITISLQLEQHMKNNQLYLRGRYNRFKWSL